MSLKNWSTTAASNNSAPPAGAPENTTLLSDVNDIMRAIMADVRTLAASDTIASATTTDLGTKDSTFLTVSGIVTITGLGTVSAGIYKYVTFSGALTLTHNATSLILFGANITTVAGDSALLLSLGAGNWRCLAYQPVGGYAQLASPTFTGVPAAPTATAGTNTTQLATTAFVATAIGPSTAFNVYQASATAQSIPASTYTKVTLDNEELDGNSNFDSTTNSRFTPTVAGNYQFNLRGRFGSLDSGTYMTMGLYKNGLQVDSINGGGGTLTDVSASFSTVVSANGSTDYFEMFAYHTSSVAKTIAGGTNGNTSFSGFRVV